MEKYVFPLTEAPTEHGFTPEATFYILPPNDCPARGMVIVCPGGGYSSVCFEREGERIATAYLAAGFHAAVVNYSVRPHVHPQALLELAQTLRLARQHAAQWRLDPHRVAVCGFSAGAHLAACLATLWNDPTYFSPEEIAQRALRPDAAVLCYPVIAPLDGADGHSFDNLIGSADPHHPLRRELALHRRVTADTPPTFLFHTWEDEQVSVENSLLYAAALHAHRVTAEVHIFTRGQHGLDLCADEPARLRCRPELERPYPWHELSCRWLYQQFGL